MSRPKTLSATFRLFTDGASRGNPGKAGIGAALYSNDSVLQARLSSFIGKTTSNVAEYQACIKGLQLARALKVPRVAVLSDSQLMVRHLHGVFAVRSDHLKGLHAQVLQLCKQFEACTFVYIPREKNGVADALANYAIDTGVAHRVILEEHCISADVLSDEGGENVEQTIFKTDERNAE